MIFSSLISRIRQNKRFLALVFTAILLLLWLLFSAHGRSATNDFDAYLNQLFTDSVTANTLNLQYTLSSPEEFGITPKTVTLGDLSREAIETAHAKTENSLSALQNFDYDSLSAANQLTYDILYDALSTELSGAKFLYYEEPLRPSTGISSQLPVLFAEYRFYDRDDIEDYLSLIACTKNYFKQIGVYETEKAEAGLFMSDSQCKQLISQCESFIADPDEHYLILTFENRVNAMEELTEEERADFCSRNTALVKETVLPAYQQLADTLSSLCGSGKNEYGLCYLPDGTDYYRYLVYYNTGCPDDVKTIAERIQAQRSKDLSDASALTTKSPSLWSECQNISLSNMDSATALSTLQQAMLADFPAAPDTTYTVSNIDACMADFMAPAFYITAPIDNYRENSIFINANTDTSSMRYFTTLAHEGFPGHLYQTVMSYDAGLAPVRTILNYPGYVEGWATYVEMISYGYAGLTDEQATLLMKNQSALLSLYASTDIGIHYSGWTLDEMRAFWGAYGISDEATLLEIYQLIVAEPAHYLKYYVGYLEFLDLKKTARETYGDAYSDIAFHRAVLTIGPAPFSIVETYLDRYYHPEN